VKYIIIAAVVSISAASAGAGIVYWRATEYHDVAWYRANIEAMRAKTAVCNDNPGLIASDPNCVNAEKASIEQSFDDFKARADALPWH